MGIIKEILYDLVSVQSNTGTALEIQMGERIYDIISNRPYFKENPTLCGKFYAGDILKRPVVWALKKGKSNRTLILNGHYDAVGLEPYGTLKDFALSPEKLKIKLKELPLPEQVKTDLQDENWHFGRGINDMKAGIAINIDALTSIENDEINILFTAVPDEENLSSGMRECGKLLTKLKDEYNLDYKLLLITEPHIRDKEDTVKIFSGSVGKIMPLVVAKGKTAHASDVMKGLNSSLIISNFISKFELSPELCEEDLGMTPPPPTVLFARDLTLLYESSVLEYSACYLNYQFLKCKTASQILDEIKAIAVSAFEDAIKKHNNACEFFNKKFSVKENDHTEFSPLVYTFEELEEIARKNNPDYEKKKSELFDEIYTKFSKGELTVQNAGIEIVKNVMELSLISTPFVTIGFIPPYYPPVNNSYLSNKSEVFENCIEKLLKDKYNLKIQKNPYFMGICDGSYSSCTDRKSEERVMASMITSEKIYSIPFSDVEKISVPMLVVGPWGKDYHTIAERVYMPDVEETIPDLVKEIAKNI